MAIKICKNCKYFVPNAMDNNLGTCRCTKNPSKINKITGEIEFRWKFCDILREDGWLFSRLDGTCGKEGRYYEEKDD